MGTVLVQGVAGGAIYGLLALGLVLIYRGSGVINFAHAEVGGLGLFVTWTLVVHTAVPWAGAAAVGIACGAAVGLLWHHAVMRYLGREHRLQATVATAALLLVLIAVQTKIWGPDPKSLPPPAEGMGVQVLGWYVGPPQLIGLAATAAVGLALAVVLQRTGLGLAARAAAHDAVAARLLGIPAGRVSAVTWGLGCALAVLAAVLVAPALGAFAPGSLTALFVRALAAAVLGGLSSLSGAVSGGIAVGVLEAAAREIAAGSTFPAASDVLLFGLILALLLLRPQGLLRAARR